MFLLPSCNVLLIDRWSHDVLSVSNLSVAPGSTPTPSSRWSRWRKTGIKIQEAANLGYQLQNWRVSRQSSCVIVSDLLADGCPLTWITNYQSRSQKTKQKKKTTHTFFKRCMRHVSGFQLYISIHPTVSRHSCVTWQNIWDIVHISQ